MQTGTIIMLIIIVVGVYGGTGLLVARNLKNEAKNLAEKDK